MVTQEWAEGFADEWIAAWNARDLARVLSHYTEDFEMSSPYIRQIAQEPSGTLKGREAVAAYWQTALERVPDLHFELRTVFVGAESLCLYYQSSASGMVAEVLFVNDNGQVYKAAAHYARI